MSRVQSQRLWSLFGVFVALCSLSVLPSQGDDEEDIAKARLSAAILYNNDGVRELQQKNFQESIRYFRLALKKMPEYKTARENLGIAYNNFCLEGHSKNAPCNTIRLLYMARYLDTANTVTLSNLEFVLNKLFPNKDRFEGRVKIAENALKHDDIYGAVVEYQHALSLRNDQTLRKKLVELKKTAGARFQESIDNEIE